MKKLMAAPFKVANSNVKSSSKKVMPKSSTKPKKQGCGCGGK